MKKTVLALLTVVVLCLAQGPGITVPYVQYATTDPTGACGPAYLVVNSLTGNISGCINGYWSSANSTGTAVARPDLNIETGASIAVVNRAAVNNLLAYAATERIAVVGIGDSNQCKDGNGGGWAGGVARALSNFYSEWGTGVLPQYMTSTPCGDGPTVAMIGGAGNFVNTGGDATLADYSAVNYAGSTSGNPYAYVLSGPSSSEPDAFIPDYAVVNVNGNLRWWNVYGTFPTGAASTFTLVIRRNSSPFTVLATGSPVTQVTGQYSIARTSLDISAATRNYNLQFRNQTVTGPYFGLFHQIENLGVTNGFAYSTLLYMSGQGARTFALTISAASANANATYFGEVRRLLGSNKVVVFVINSGANDRNDTNPSVGPIGGLNSSTPAGWSDNIQGIINRIVAIWTTNGWDTTKLGFLIMPTHEITSGNNFVSATVGSGGTCTNSFPIVLTPTNGGSAGAGTARSNGTTVTEILVTNRGTGYIGVPTIGNGGCALTATAVLGGGDDSKLISYRRAAAILTTVNPNTSAVMLGGVATAATTASNGWYASGSAGATDNATNIHLQYSGYINISNLLMQAMLQP